MKKAVFAALVPFATVALIGCSNTTKAPNSSAPSDTLTYGELTVKNLNSTDFSHSPADYYGLVGYGRTITYRSYASKSSDYQTFSINYQPQGIPGNLPDNPTGYVLTTSIKNVGPTNSEVDEISPDGSIKSTLQTNYETNTNDTSEITKLPSRIKKGVSWTYDDNNSTYTNTIKGLANVKTPFGEYDNCLVVDQTQDLDNNASITTMCYYAPGIGEIATTSGLGITFATNVYNWPKNWGTYQPNDTNSSSVSND